MHTEIGILTSAAKVWDILAAAERWTEWNPFAQVSGRFAPGERLQVTITPPGRRSSTFRPIVTKVEEGREIRWRGSLGLPGLFDGEHGFRITPESEGRCRFEQFEMFSGVLVAPVMWMLGDATREGFEGMNRALKARSEAAAG